MAMWDESRVIWDFKDVERRNQYQGEVQHVVLIFFLLLLSSTALVPSSVSVSFLFFFSSSSLLPLGWLLSVLLSCDYQDCLLFFLILVLVPRNKFSWINAKMEK